MQSTGLPVVGSGGSPEGSSMPQTPCLLRRRLQSPLLQVSPLSPKGRGHDSAPGCRTGCGPAQRLMLLVSVPNRHQLPLHGDLF